MIDRSLFLIFSILFAQDPGFLQVAEIVPLYSEWVSHFAWRAVRLKFTRIILLFLSLLQMLADFFKTLFWILSITNGIRRLNFRDLSLLHHASRLLRRISLWNHHDLTHLWLISWIRNAGVIENRLEIPWNLNIRHPNHIDHSWVRCMEITSLVLELHQLLLVKVGCKNLWDLLWGMVIHLRN